MKDPKTGASADQTESPFVKWAVDLGMTTQARVDSTAKKHRLMKGGETRLKDFFDDIGLERQQLNHLIAVNSFYKQTNRDSHFGEISKKNNFVEASVIDEKLTIQYEDIKRYGKCCKLGQMLVRQGEMTTLERDLVLAKQPNANPSANAAYRSARKNKEAVEMQLNALLDLVVTGDKMTAWLTAEGPFPNGTGAAHIENWLFAKGIRFGLNSRNIKAMHRENTPGEKYRVAEGAPPVSGQDGSIEFYFSTDALPLAGKGGGSIRVPSVTADTLLAVRVPGTNGRKGTNINGYQVPLPPVKDAELKVGDGVRSEDGLEFYAAIGGRPKLAEKNILSVDPSYLFEGDVEKQNVGAIHFDHDVVVNGRVKEGVEIRCRTLKAWSIQGAKIAATGGVAVKNQIVGAQISALCGADFPLAAPGKTPKRLWDDSGKIQSQEIRDSTIKTLGDIEVANEISGSTIQTCGACRVWTEGTGFPAGKIVSSRIVAIRGITAVEIGSAGSEICELVVGEDVNSEEKAVILRRDLELLLLRRKKLKGASGNGARELREIAKKIKKKTPEFIHVWGEMESLERQTVELLAAGEMGEAAFAEEMLKEQEKVFDALKATLDTLYDRRDKLNSTMAKNRASAAIIRENIDRMAVLAAMDPEIPEGGPAVSYSGKLWESTVIRGEVKPL